MRAWLVTWEGSGNHEELEKPVVVILSWRYSPERVRKLVEQMYINHTATIGKQLAFAKNKKRNPYPAYYDTYRGANVTWQIFCGHNPWLHARLVEELHLEGNDYEKQKLSWIEYPRPKAEKREASLYINAT